MANMLTQPLRVFKVLFTYSATLYLVVFLFFHFGIDQRAWRAKTLNFLSLPINDLVHMADGEIPFKREIIERYMEFYQNVLEVLPNDPATLGMVGYCYYHLGDVDSARSYYKKAVKHNGNFLWFYYNLGAIEFNQRNYEAAAGYFQKAVSTNDKTSLLFMRSSRIFSYQKVGYREQSTYEFPVVNMMPRIVQNLKKGYPKAFENMLLSLYFAQDYNSLMVHSSQAISAGEQYQKFAYYYAGLASYHLGQESIAVGMFNRDIVINSGKPQSYYFLGKTFEKMGKDSVARETLEYARTLGWGEKMDSDPKRIDLVIF